MDRSQVVAAYLVSKGVEPSRLSTAGYGSQCPVDTKTDEGALQKNRHVDFKVLETTSGCTNKWFVCDEAVAAGLVPEKVMKYLPGNDHCDSLL